MIAAPLLIALLAALSAAAAPAQRQSAAAAAASDSLWIPTGDNFYVPRQPAPASFRAGRTTPAATLSPPSFAPLPSVTATPAATAPPDLRALDKRAAPVWTLPGQIARSSAMAVSRASVTSSMRHAGTCRFSSDCVSTAPANANHYCNSGVCSYRCRSGFTDTGSVCAETCSVSSDCSNNVPGNANRFCDNGLCSYRCRSGFSASGSSCLAAISSTTTTRTTTTTKTTTTTSASAAPTCVVSSDCTNFISGNANRYCDAGKCSYRCRSGFTPSGSSCVPSASSTTATMRPTTTTTARTTTTTTTSAPATQTCTATAQCTNALPANANRYCDNGMCSFRCRSGYDQSGSTCITSPSLGGSSTTRWMQNPSFSSLAAFKSDVINSGKFSWGDTQGNLAVMADGVPANAWTGGVKGDSGPALQVRYPAGSRNPSASPVGGMGFYTSKIDVSQATNVSFSYSLFFEDGFNFVKGGKLPGLYGGKTACSGGSTAESCFSARLMFRKGGMGELYLYAPREKQVPALCELGPLSYCNSVYGMSIGRGSWTFKTGEWTDIRQDIWLNTPGVADGGFNIWINGKLVLTSSSVYYRNSPVGLISSGSNNSTSTVLVDYDALPDSVEILNGGFSSNGTDDVFHPSFVTKIVGPTATASSTQSYEDSDGDITATSLPADWEARRRRRNLVPLLGAVTRTPAPTPTRASAQVIPTRIVEKRATVATTVPGFLGAMCQTFFGGSSSDYNSPTLQHTYFRGFGLAVNA